MTQEEFLKKDKYIGPLVERFGKCALSPRPKNLYFQSLVRAISGQQLSVKAAATIYSRLKEKVGKMTAENILKVSDEDLRGCGLSFAKISYIKDLAERTLDGRLNIRQMDKLSESEVREELIAVKGIGVWTAEMFLMFTLGAPDIFPSSDLGIKNGLEKLTGRARTQVQMDRFARRWSPYRSAAAWYIWESLDNKPNS